VKKIMSQDMLDLLQIKEKGTSDEDHPAGVREREMCRGASYRWQKRGLARGTSAGIC
jgi:hypothetical protein